MLDLLLDKRAVATSFRQNMSFPVCSNPHHSLMSSPQPASSYTSEFDAWLVTGL